MCACGCIHICNECVCVLAIMYVESVRLFIHACVYLYMSWLSSLSYLLCCQLIKQTLTARLNYNKRITLLINCIVFMKQAFKKLLLLRVQSICYANNMQYILLRKLYQMNYINVRKYTSIDVIWNLTLLIKSVYNDFGNTWNWNICIENTYCLNRTFY